MIVIDFHGDRLEEAVEEIHRVVSETRAKRAFVELKVITGHGIIKSSVKRILEGYGLHPKDQIGNTGVVLCDVE